MEQEEFGCEIESEVRFLNLFGYRVIGPDDFNRYMVVDNKRKDIGFIQKKKMHNANKNSSAIFGYYMQIKSDKVQCQNVRRQDDSNDTSYQFILQNNDQVCICVDANLNLTIRSKEYGHIHFSMKKNKIVINCDRTTACAHIEETIFIQSSEKKKVYEFCISSCSKNKKMANAKNRITYHVGFLHDSSYDENHISVHELHWKGNGITKDQTAIVHGTIEEVIQNSQKGHQIYQYFRNALYQLLPFQQEAISLLLEKINLKELALLSDDAKAPYQKSIGKIV